MMKLQRLLPTPLILCLLLSANVGADLEKGSTAYEAGDYKTAVRLWESVAQQVAEAQYLIGGIYHQNVLQRPYPKISNVERDYKAAFSWYAKSAVVGHAKAQGSLGFMHQRGQGTTKDLKAAAEWYTKAAEQGDSVAQQRLGEMYQKGEGVPKDLVYAYMWTKISVADANANFAELFLSRIKKKYYLAATCRSPEISWRVR